MRRIILPALILISLAAGLSIPGCRNGKDAGLTGSQAPLGALTEFRGRIVFQSNMDGDNEIYVLTGQGLSQLTSNDWEDGFPAWSPDGEAIAFQADPEGQFDIYVMRADGSDIKRATSSPEDEMEPSWFPDGLSLSFTRETGGLLRGRGAQHRVDLRSGRTRRLIPDFSGTHGIGHVSPSGTQIVLTAKRMRGWDVAVYDLDLKRMIFLEEGGRSCRARFSPDGRRLVYVSSKADGKGDIWTMAPDGSGKDRLTLRPETYDYFPDWSSDGRFITFNSSTEHGHDDDWGLFLLEVDTGRIALLFDSPGNDIFPDWY